MRIRYQADADLNQKIVTATIRLEPRVDFRTANAASLAGKDDLDVLEIAAKEGRILVTHDKSTMPDNFAQFVAEHDSPGVFIVPRGLRLAGVAEELILIWGASESDEWVNRITYIPL
jgi:predicted nuclease of predicted toxin-antitoxin system